MRKKSVKQKQSIWNIGIPDALLVVHHSTQGGEECRLRAGIYTSPLPLSMLVDYLKDRKPAEKPIKITRRLSNRRAVFQRKGCRRLVVRTIPPLSFTEKTSNLARSNDVHALASALLAYCRNTIPKAVIQFVLCNIRLRSGLRLAHSTEGRAFIGLHDGIIRMTT